MEASAWANARRPRPVRGRRPARRRLIKAVDLTLGQLLRRLRLRRRRTLAGVADAIGLPIAAVRRMEARRDPAGPSPAYFAALEVLQVDPAADLLLAIAVRLDAHGSRG